MRKGLSEINEVTSAMFSFPRTAIGFRVSMYFASCSEETKAAFREIIPNSYEKVEKFLFDFQRSRNANPEDCKRATDICIETIQKFKDRASKEHEFLEFYNDLQEQVEDFMCSLLNKVRPR